MVRLALIGCDTASDYVAVLPRVRSADIVATVDDDGDKARWAAKTLGAQVLNSIDKALASDHIDAVLIHARNGGPVGRQAANAKIEMMLIPLDDDAKGILRVVEQHVVGLCRLLPGHAVGDKRLDVNSPVDEHLRGVAQVHPGSRRVPIAEYDLASLHEASIERQNAGAGNAVARLV